MRTTTRSIALSSLLTLAITGTSLSMTSGAAMADELDATPTPTATSVTAPAESPAESEAPASNVTTKPVKLTAAQQRAKRVKARKAKVRAAKLRHAKVVKTKRERVVKVALKKRGARYIAGRSGPSAFDCSGFTKWVYKKATGRNLVHYSASQMRQTKRVKLSRKALKPGDLLFYGPGARQHVSLYIGKGRMIHAANPRAGVYVTSWRTMSGSLHSAGRVIK